MKLHPYRFLGDDGTHLGRHGIIKKNDVVWLDEQEHSYVQMNPSPTLKHISDAEVAKLKLVAPNQTGDGSPEGAETGLPKNNEADALAAEIEAMEKSLVDDFSKKELLALCDEHEIKPETDANKATLAKLLAPAVVKKNREEAVSSKD